RIFLCVDRLPPVIQELSRCAVECEPVSTIRRGLLVPPADRESGEMAIEQCPRAPMTDNGNVTIVEGLRHHLLYGVNDPRLGICCRLPASDAGLRISKERVNCRF